MRKLKHLTIVSATLFFMAGCFNSIPPEPKEDLPESVGKLKKGSVISNLPYQLSDGKNYPSWETRYSSEPDKVTGKFTSIKYVLGIHKNAEEAGKEQARYADCYTLGAWKTDKIKDKAGKEVGTFTICRKRAENSSVGDRNYAYNFIFNNENRTVKIEPLTATNQDLIEFTKALPFNSQTDLSIIDALGSLQNLETAKLMAMSPPVQKAKEPYLKGKTVITSISEIQTENYISDKNKIAQTTDEMQSLVKIKCEKAALIGEYVIKETGEGIPAFASQCKVSVIDNTIPAIIGEKTFTNKELPERSTFYKSYDPKRINNQLEYVAPYPNEEIKKFIAGLPMR